MESDLCPEKLAFNLLKPIFENSVCSIKGTA